MEPENNAAELEAVKARLATTEATLSETAKVILADVPDHLKGLIPASLAPADQIAWFKTAKATGVFSKPIVPATDAGTKPTITPTTPDASALPTFARMASGYRK
ncbi:hypothetical protein H5J25_09625 [Sphingomonas aliaeris]|uniref:Uncharacterized protein n=1 Tax=Sphingomonas aliaeris TaxID=2759526 RepID=A0A974NS19_9SPHN|nr:hypothetical protein [Sphingomonas aliaeris]QQV75876.1 hypothetical protein H5J25_09625 [Sphingomonas aliaeris]